MNVIVQQIAVIITLMLYTIFAITPVAGVSMFSRTLNIAPGDLMMVFIGLNIIIELLVKKTPKSRADFRSTEVVQFLSSYFALAAIFFAPTILFFLLRNEFATYIPRNIYVFFLWLIPLILFYYGTASPIRYQDVKRIMNLLLVSFLAGVFGGMLTVAPGLSLIELIFSSLTSSVSRLSGQIEDPNQLGTIAAFFTVFAVIGMIKEKSVGQKAFFFLMTAGTSLVLLLTQSRESLATLFIALVCFVFVILREKKLLSGFLLTMVLLMAVLLSLWFIPRITDTITAIQGGETGDALSSRDVVWKTALDIVSTNPLGIGFETMYLITGSTAMQAHNAFLQAAVVAGGLGFLLFINFLYFLIKLLWKQRSEHQYNWLLDAYIVFLVGYLVTAMWSDHFISFFTFNAIFFGFLGFVVRSHD